jgi:hypothetical protein
MIWKARMKDYQKMTKAELIERLKALEATSAAQLREHRKIP